MSLSASPSPQVDDLQRINSAQNGWILSTRDFQWEPQGFFSALRFHDTWKTADRGVWTPQCSLPLFVFFLDFFSLARASGTQHSKSVPQSDSIACAAALGQIYLPHGTKPGHASRIPKTHCHMDVETANATGIKCFIPRSLLADIGRYPLPKFTLFCRSSTTDRCLPDYFFARSPFCPTCWPATALEMVRPVHGDIYVPFEPWIPGMHAGLVWSLHLHHLNLVCRIPTPCNTSVDMPDRSKLTLLSMQEQSCAI